MPANYGLLLVTAVGGDEWMAGLLAWLLVGCGWGCRLAGASHSRIVSLRGLFTGVHHLRQQPIQGWRAHREPSLIAHRDESCGNLRFQNVNKTRRAMKRIVSLVIVRRVKNCG